MKGQVSWIIGIVIVILTSVIFAFGVTLKHSEEKQIVSSSAELYSTIHSAEKLKRAVDADAAYVSKTSLAAFLADGGGFGYWTNVSPTAEQLSAALGNNIADKMDIETEGLEGRVIVWSGPSASVQVTDGGFSYSGTYPFRIRDMLSNPQVTVDSASGFEGSVNTGYFTLTSKGLELALKCPVLEAEAGRQDPVVWNVTAVEGQEKLFDVNVTGETEGLQLLFRLNCSAD